jgi:hypothetical protein
LTPEQPASFESPIDSTPEKKKKKKKKKKIRKNASPISPMILSPSDTTNQTITSPVEEIPSKATSVSQTIPISTTAENVPLTPDQRIQAAREMFKRIRARSKVFFIMNVVLPTNVDPETFARYSFSPNYHQLPEPIRPQPDSKIEFYDYGFRYFFYSFNVEKANPFLNKFYYINNIKVRIERDRLSPI